MSKRVRAISEENASCEAGPAEEPPETRRTRSGRAVRTPCSLLEAAVRRTPTRRTRRSVLQEVPAVEEQNTEEPEQNRPEDVNEETPIICDEPEPCTGSEPQAEAAAADTDGANGHLSRPAPAETAPASSETIPMMKRQVAPTRTQALVIPLGKPKSGRVWKDRSKQRFSAVVRDKQLCTSWEKKMAAKREKELVKQYSQQLKDEKTRQKEDQRKRREENLRRRAENERKAEIVQVIRNTAKIKRMKKKQLRKIEKRDTLALLQKSQKQNVKAKAKQTVEPDFT